MALCVFDYYYGLIFYLFYQYIQQKILLNCLCLYMLTEELMNHVDKNHRSICIENKRLALSLYILHTRNPVKLFVFNIKIINSIHVAFKTSSVRT